MQRMSVVDARGVQPPARYLSQSECGDWLTCHLRAYARWVLEYRPPTDETFAQRVGSLGHAVLHERVAARFAGRPPDLNDASAREADRRGWTCEWGEAAALGTWAAMAIAREIDIDRLDLVPDIYTDGDDRRSGPLAEARLRANWTRLAEFFRDAGGSMCSGWRDVMRCEAVRSRFAGIEGTPDLVCLPGGPGGVVAVVDYKFRQSLDLGGAGDERGPHLPDRQASWYLALLWSVGLRPAAGFEFWQVNAYAGRWLAVEDFLRVADGGATSEAEAGLVTSHGLPTRDLSRYADARAAVSADAWAEAHRVLAQRRYRARVDEWRLERGGKGRAPSMLTDAEEAAARRFVADLAAQKQVVVRKFRADPLVCREVVRDMIVAVDGPLGQALRGMTPARNVQTYRSAPCVRPGGCQLQSICLPALGTFTVDEALTGAASMLREHQEEAADAV